MSILKNSVIIFSKTTKAVITIIATFITTILLIISGILLSLKSGVLFDTSLYSIIDNEKVYDTVKDSIIDITIVEFKKYGFDEKTMSKLITNDLINEIAILTTTIIEDENASIDLSGIDKEATTIYQKTASMLVDEYIDSLYLNDGVVSDASIENNSIVKSFTRRYDVNLDEQIKFILVSKYGYNINLEEYGKEELKNSLLKEVTSYIEPELLKQVDAALLDAQSRLEELSYDLHSTKFMDDYNKFKNIIDSFLLPSIIVSLIIVFLIHFFEILLYLKEKYKVLRNLFVSFLLSSIVLLIIGHLTFIFKNFINSFLANLTKEELTIFNLILSFEDAILNPFNIISLIFFSLAVFFFSLYVLLSKKIKINQIKL